MSTMSGKSSPEGEEGAGRMKSESWGQSNAVGEVRRGRVILAAYLIVTLELTLLFMQFGVVPYLAKNLGLDSVGFGYLQTTFGVLQLVGGPIFGRFADQFGSRAALTLSCASASAFFLLLSISTSIPILFLSRLPTVFMHGLPGAQKVITDLTAPSERAAALGKLGLCFGVGIIIGSALGGVLSTKFGALQAACPQQASLPLCCSRWFADRSSNTSPGRTSGMCLFQEMTIYTYSVIPILACPSSSRIRTAGTGARCCKSLINQ
ncbi:solute carrier family 22 member 18-like isoform X1 [Coturnix japonica]|uniref:solute carrier family 22 member 18-like isoform X1 n=1 Tax=Coturnix japonica TaxID=93934 RepID=UPI000777CDE2|nr:solute carrier family 22 member 18-like isoform X1 [Coturnix japonica]